MKHEKTVTLEAACFAASRVEKSGEWMGGTGERAHPHSTFASVMTH